MQLIFTFNLMKNALLPKLFILFCSMVSMSALAQYKQPVHNYVELHKNPQGLIPFKRLDDYKMAVISLSSTTYSPFINMVNRYADVASFEFDQYVEKTKFYNTLLIAGNLSELRGDHLAMIQQSLANGKKIIFCSFASNQHSALSQWNTLRKQNIAFLEVENAGVEQQEQMAMSVFGGLSITQGTHKTEQTRLQYTQAIGSGLDIGKMTQKIDAIAQEAIRERGAPGMVVMAIKNGQVIFEKSYGYHTYENKIPTKTTDIFDLASISKIAGTTPVIMHLQESKMINLDSTISHYLYQAKGTNKEQVQLKTVLLHEGGFTPYIPFYRDLKAGDLQTFPSATHQVKVADNAYLVNDYYEQIMWPTMLKSSIKDAGKYIYSDISMYVMQEVAEHKTGVPLNEYVTDFLYKPIGMKTAGYNPRTRFEKDQIVPTENDTSFRKVLLEGYVHDQGAAMAGGVAGHAGLFSTANDLAIYAQLLLNRGTYGGVKYYQPQTVDLFTSNQSRVSRRGYGFDRADPDPKKEYPSSLANSTVYGHTGYTGTCIWIDPKHQLTYIFLSNRVHPQVSTKLLNLNIRSRIQDAIYETINEAK